MEAILIFVAFLCALHSHLRCKRIFDQCSLVRQVSPIVPKKPLYKPAYKEIPVIAFIVFVIFIIVIQFL